jgi:hypothetical protein
MRRLSNTTGSASDSETPGETGDIAASFTGEDYYEKLVRQANVVPITSLFKFYGIRVDIHNRTITCPFKSHKRGRENSSSFNYYPHTNSFYCFGCKIGGEYAHSVELVAAMEGISRVKAAYKIFDLFKIKPSGDFSEDENLLTKEDFSEQLEIMLEFSTSVREFRENFSDEKSIEFIEKLCEIFDSQNNKRRLSNEALRRVVAIMKNRINNYIQCIAL